MILLDKALKYCNDVLEGKEITTDEVKLQCKTFLDDYYKNQYLDEFEFCFSEKKLKKINNLLKLFNYATGFIAGKQVLEGLEGFQCLFLVFFHLLQINHHQLALLYHQAERLFFAIHNYPFHQGGLQLKELDTCLQVFPIFQ